MNDSRQKPADEAVRVRAVNDISSFIVQAPAGAGKTELLIQRTLRLLATVDEPEEIVALTFTRKAAAEMRLRLHDALLDVHRLQTNVPEYKQATRRLAESVLRRSDEKGWQLEGDVSRLRISTIDSLNTTIARSAPTINRGAGWRTIHERPRELYALAAQRAIARIGDREDSAESAAARQLLTHLGNRVDRLVDLLTEMLAKRDQWLRLTVDAHSRESRALRDLLEKHLARIVDLAIDSAVASIDAEYWPEIETLTRHAAAQLANDKADSRLEAWQNSTGLPATNHSNLDAWAGLAGIWLTKDGRWRKSVDKRSGFPTTDRATKERAVELLAQLGAENSPDGLAVLLELPAPTYPQGQWDALGAALSLLQTAAIELNVAFRQFDTTDFPEIASDALVALGGEENPTDLALLLDYSIRHILVDEFQDTSRAQFDLIAALTRGWEPGDGRTLFVVGDPMQSIYRFREADVGLYLLARENGIGSVPLIPLELVQNFRSAVPVVDWINRVFAGLAPKGGSDPTTGAVSFLPAVAAEEARADDGVNLYMDLSHGGSEQDQIVTGLVTRLVAGDAEDTIGVLVRSRNQAKSIVRSLAQAGIDFLGTDLDPLREMSCVQDLLALTRAICHLADRIAWLSILRAPWAGMTLDDLERLAGNDREACIVDLLRDRDALSLLSGQGRVAAGRVLEALEPALSKRGSTGLRDLVHGVWQRLAGAATLSSPEELNAVEQFFACLERIDNGGDYGDIDVLMAALEEQTAITGSIDAQVRIMTIHKAKGLEFDHVILPGLGIGTRNSSSPILAWRELATPDGPSLLMSPIEGYGATPDPLYRLIRRLEKEQGDFESDRLMYVACTRARHSLHLVGQLKAAVHGATPGDPRPAGGTLLSRVWPVLGTEFCSLFNQQQPTVRGSERENRWMLSATERLSAGWDIPDPAKEIPFPSVPHAEASPPVVYDWASRQAMHVGRVVHLWLRAIAEEGLDQWSRTRVSQLRSAIESSLRAEGVPDHAIDDCAGQVGRALDTTLSDETGRWILSDAHPVAHCEFEIAVFRDGAIRHLVIDRVFVDRDGTAYIVDYKTSSHEGGDISAFYAQEAERYKPQLDAYRRAWSEYRAGEVKTVLYFPLLSHMLEV